MPTSHNRRCGNTIYMYEDNLLWVWSRWGASIITCSMIQSKTKSKRISNNSHWAVRPSIYQVRVGSLWPLATVNTIYMYEDNLLWVWSRWGASSITCSIIQVKNRVNIQQLPLNCETKHISGWCCILMTTSHCSRCWIALYIYTKTCYEYEVDGGPQT
jgi:hypothetical protein